MPMFDQIRKDPNRVNAAHSLTRNNIEFAGVVVYFFSLAVLFAITIIVMMCQTGSTNEKSAIDHQPLEMVSSADYR
jgi:hypothetical protein